MGVPQEEEKFQSKEQDAKIQTATKNYHVCYRIDAFKNIF